MEIFPGETSEKIQYMHFSREVWIFLDLSAIDNLLNGVMDKKE